jgi:hypothetical protein
LRSHRLAYATRALVGHGLMPLGTPPTALCAVPPPRAGEGLAPATKVSAQGHNAEVGQC